MKKGYKKLYIYQFFLFFVMFLNYFLEFLSSRFRVIIFLIIILVLFYIFFGFERDNHRYIKDFIMNIFITLMLFFIVYYLLGLFFGYARTNYLNYEGFKRFIIPTFIYIILREFFRYNALCKSGNNKVLIVLTTIFCIFLDLSGLIGYINLDNNLKIFNFITIYFLPVLSSNVVFSYISINIGYKPVIFFSIIVDLYRYVLPIIPNPNQYIETLILFLLPLCMGYLFYNMNLKNNKDFSDNVGVKDKSNKLFLVMLINASVLVYFISGYFSYWAIVVASGSMSNQINKGDIVIIKKMNDNFDELDVNQVIAYKHQDTIIVHRIVDKVLINNNYYFSTKGDANNSVDSILVEEDMIVGKIDYRIPYLGLLTLWLNNL